MGAVGRVFHIGGGTIRGRRRAFLRITEQLSFRVGSCSVHTALWRGLILLRQHLDERPHPGMDAALKAVVASAQSCHLY
jgi:hypothetical protein